MDELFSLAKSLHMDEVNAVRLSFKKTKKDTGDALLLEQLFNHIILKESKIKSDKSLALLLYKSNKTVALSKLKSRLFSFILDVISIDSLLNKEHIYDNIDRQNIRIRKKLLQFRILYRRKNKVDLLVLIHLLNEIISEAKRYEQYDTLSEAMTFKKCLLISRKGFDEIKKIEKEILYYQNAQRFSILANDVYLSIVANQEVIRKTDPKQFRSQLIKSILELETFVKQTNSATVTYLKKLLKLELLIIDNEKRKAIDLCYEILNHVQESPSLNKKERLGEVYDNLSYCLVLNENYNLALDTSRKAQEFYSKESTHYLLSKQQEFFVYFYSGQYEQALSTIDMLLNLPLLNTGEFRYDKFLFFKAFVYFNLKKFKETLTTCNKSLSVSKDKGRWDFGNRYLRIMSLCELNHSEDATSAIEALRKVVVRNKKENFLSDRDEYIYKAFCEFSKTNFSSSGSKKLITILDELKKRNSSLAWKHYTHELYPIDSWLHSKLKKSK